MSEFHIPALSRADMVSIIQELEVAAVTENDIKNPVPDFIAELYARLLIHLDLLNEEEQGQVDFEALELLENPDHHVGSVRTVDLYCRIRLLVDMVHCPVDFNLKDLLRPQPQRTELFLSAILNFCLHRNTKMNHLQSIGDEITLLQEQQREWEAKINELNEDIASFDAEREKELPLVQELGAKVKELRQALGKRGAEQVQFRTHYQSLKEKAKEMDEEISKAEFSLVQSVQENASLRSKIVQSPDKLLRALEEKRAVLQDVKNGERSVKESFEEKTKKLEVYTKALKNMSKHFTWMQSIQEQVSKAKSIEKEYKALKAKLSDDEVVAKSLSAKLAELHVKAQQLDEQRKLLEQERNLKIEEATKGLSNLKLQVEARRRDLEARQRNVEAMLSEVDALTTKTNSIKESTAAKVKVIVCKREEVVEQFQRYRVSVDLADR